MVWDNTISLVDIFTIIASIFAIASAVAVVVGFFFGLKKWGHNKETERANYVNELFVNFYKNKDYADVFYKIDYGNSWYTLNFHKDLETQRKVDSVLTLMSYVCYLSLTGQISDSELKFVNYKLDRTLNNKGVKEYLYNLYHFAKENLSFYWLLKYAEKNCDWVNEDFKNPNSENYPHYLNRII